MGREVMNKQSLTVDEIKSSLSKKKILKSEDATLIKKFIDKISNEIREAN